MSMRSILIRLFNKQVSIMRSRLSLSLKANNRELTTIKMSWLKNKYKRIWTEKSQTIFCLLENKRATELVHDLAGLTSSQLVSNQKSF